MKFAEVLFSLMKRIAASKVARERTYITEDGLFELEVFAVSAGEAVHIAALTEHATEAEIVEFEKQLERLENAAKAQDEEDAANEVKIREILERLTPEERVLIERPLPEDLPPPDEGEEHY